MAMFWSTNSTETNGQSLIRTELDRARALLKDRKADLEKARRHVTELEDTCARLEERVAGLERDERALTRGFIALMGDAAAPRT